MAIKERHKIVFKEVLKGRSYKNAMIKAGFSPKTAANNNKLTRTKSWQQLLDEYLSDEKLTKVHNEGLQAVEKDGAIDYSVRHKYLETGYKVKGKMLQTESGNKTLVLVVSGETASRYVKAHDETGETPKIAEGQK